MPTLTKPVHFGSFEVDLGSGELRKNGIKIHLAEQPLRILTLLLEHPGEIVTREELRSSLWSSDTFVDFEHGLNAAVKRLREALGDSAENPKFIETIPRRGYRFVYPVAGSKSEDPPEPAIPQRGRKRRWGVVLGSVILVLAVLVIAFVSRGTSSFFGKDESAAAAMETIAVLPFVDMSPQKDQEYFSDGLAEELLTNLAKIPGLRVSARTSSFQFKGKNEDAQTIGKRLNVHSVLEGGVRRDSNRVRITVQLINASDGFHIWSESYDRTLDDIFTVQQEIAKAVAESLKVSLLSSNPAAPRNVKMDPQAYNLYLQAKYFSARRTQADVSKAIEYFEKALTIDPNFARAWAGLAEAYTHLADSGYIPVEEGYGKARAAVERALQLDGNLVEAQLGMAWIKRTHDWDWAGAEALYKRATTLEPGNAVAMWESATLAYTMGRLEQAIALDRKALELDPLDTTGLLNLGVVCYYAGKYSDSADALQKSLEINPAFPVAHAYLSRVYLMDGRPAEALAEAEKEPDLPWRLYAKALSHHALQNKVEADNALAELETKYQDVFASQIAEVYGFRGDVEKSFEWLERAYKQRDGGLTELKGNPMLRSVQGDPRLAAMLKKMNLAE